MRRSGAPSKRGLFRPPRLDADEPSAVSQNTDALPAGVSSGKPSTLHAAKRPKLAFRAPVAVNAVAAGRVALAEVNQGECADVTSSAAASTGRAKMPFRTPVTARSLASTAPAAVAKPQDASVDRKQPKKESYFNVVWCKRCDDTVARTLSLLRGPVRACRRVIECPRGIRSAPIGAGAWDTDAHAFISAWTDPPGNTRSGRETQFLL